MGPDSNNNRKVLFLWKFLSTFFINAYSKPIFNINNNQTLTYTQILTLKQANIPHFRFTLFNRVFRSFLSKKLPL